MQTSTRDSLPAMAGEQAGARSGLVLLLALALPALSLITNQAARDGGPATLPAAMRQRCAFPSGERERVVLVLVLFCGARFFRAPFHLLFQITVLVHGGLKMGDEVGSFDGMICPNCNLRKRVYPPKNTIFPFCSSCWYALPADLRKRICRDWRCLDVTLFPLALEVLRADVQK
jgi:hypothetical protein